MVENQLAFIFGHEIGHVMCHSSKNIPQGRKIEFEADDFSMDILRRLEVRISVQITLGLLVNWLYNKLKKRNMSHIKINDHPYDLEETKSIKDAIAKESDERQ